MEFSWLSLTKINGKAPTMDVIRKLINNGVKASSNPSATDTIMENIINKALTSNALPTFEDIAFIFIVAKL